MIKRNKVLVVTLSLVASFSVFSQKKELKKVNRLIKSGKYWPAFKELKVVEPLAKGTEYESYFYFLKGKSLFGKNNVEKYPEALKSFNNVVAIEKGKGEYTSKANSYIKIINSNYLSTIARALKANDYSKAGKVYEEYATIYPQRRDVLINTLYSYQQAKNDDKVAEIAELLLKKDKSKFSYTATNSQTKRVEEFFSKEFRDNLLKNNYTDAKDLPIEDKVRQGYYGYLVRVYSKKNMGDKALSVLKKAEEEFPKHSKFYEDYAAIMLNKGDKPGYVAAVEQALKVNPENKSLWFNLGVVSQELKNNEAAINAYTKAIEIDSTYYAAHLNKGVVIMSKEQSLIDELNKNRSNKIKYKEVNRELNAMYLKGIKSFEQAYKIKPSENVKSALINLYKATKQEKKIGLL